ncbi:MAG: DUF1993 domain-containing protein [Pseudomonadales bacterium]|nr:DUF1993 domain-containing protein [Pseudomonadales bacterium]
MTNLYNISFSSYKQVLGATITTMEKGAQYFDEQGLNTRELIEMRLAPDMAAFPFQVQSVRHHSLGAARGLIAGEFSPPPSMPDRDYQGYIDLLTETLTELDTISEDAITAIEGKAITFKLGEHEIPFTTENFVLSFSLPNLYFHATTVYNMLRIKGVPLGKVDFMGQMSVGLPES